MGKFGKMDIKGLEKFQKEMEKLQENQNQFLEECAKELAARLLEKVIKRTPVGDYSDTYDLEDDGEKKFLVMSDKEGGTLRRGWKIETIRKEGNVYKIDIINPVDYASYVEYGHRQQKGRYVPAIGAKLKKSWVKGHFMMTISENEIRDIAPGVLEKKLEKYLRECMK